MGLYDTVYKAISSLAAGKTPATHASAADERKEEFAYVVIVQEGMGAMLTDDYSRADDEKQYGARGQEKCI